MTYLPLRRCRAFRVSFQNVLSVKNNTFLTVTIFNNKIMATRDLVSIFGKAMDYFEGIDFETFITLQPDHIKEAIPALVPRIKFQNSFKRFMETLDKENINLEVNHNTTTIVDENYTPIEIDVTNFNSVEAPAFDESSFTVTATPTSSSEIISNPYFRIKKTVDIKTTQDIIDIPSIELKIIITNCISNQKPIENNDRVVIGKVIIHHLLVHDYERVITRPEFIDLSILIVKLFPHEVLGTYYIPAIKSEQAQGKLYSAYQNYKAHLRESGLIEKRAIALREIENQPLQLAEKSEAFKILLEESEDFENIIQCWQFCYPERQHLLKELSVFEYIRKFPSFDSPEGYKLLTLDADRLLGSKTSKLAEIAPKIILFASRKKRIPLEAKSLLVGFKELSENLDANDLDVLQQLTAIKLLPHLMTVKKKCSKSEVANLFCHSFKTETDADISDVKFKETYKESSLVLKPRLYFVGGDLGPQAQIRFADKRYLIEDGLMGFETLFKCFLGLNCKYPEETLHLWQFIQTEVYDIQSCCDKKSSTLLTFIQDIRSIAIE